MKIKVEPFLMKKGIRVAKAAIEFDSGVLAGFHLVGFTICDEREKGLYVLFPSSIIPRREDTVGPTKQFFFLRSSNDEDLGRLEEAILDIYESMTGRFNTPKLTTT